MRKIRKYFTGVSEEAHRVRWPSFHDLWVAVGIVLAVTIICCLVLLLSDYLALQMKNAFDRAGGSDGDKKATTEALQYIANYLGGWF